MNFTKGYKAFKTHVSFIGSINKITYIRSLFIMNDTKNHGTRLLTLIEGLIFLQDSHDLSMKKLKMEFNQEVVLGKLSLNYI